MTAAKTPEFASEVARPLAPSRSAPNNTMLRNTVVGLTLAAIVAGVSTLAWKLRDNPAELAKVRPTPSVETPADPASSAKIVERIGAGPGPASPTTPQTATKPAQPAVREPTPPAAVAPSSEQPLPVGQRAALLVEAPDEPQKVKTLYGSVIWKLERPAEGGLPVLRADVDIGEAKLAVTMTISRSADVKAAASHIITIRFAPGADSIIPGVAEIETPSMRVEDRPVGEPLEGRPAPVTSNYFLVGLIREEALTTRNIDLLRNRGWVDIPMRLTSDKIAKITFEKGAVGERLMAEALDAWK